MFLNQVIPTLATLYKRQVETGERFSVELVSGPGLGKSQCIDQTATAIKKLMGLDDFTVKKFFLSTVEAPDVRGYGLPDMENHTMYFTDAPWMPKEGDAEHGFVFLDEFRQSGHDVQKPAAELLNNGSVGDSQLPITYMTVAASNREEDRSGVQRPLAFIENRRVLLKVEPHLDSWVDWAQTEGGIHWAAIAFAKAHPGLIFSDRVPDKPGPFCTPRSFCKVSHLIGDYFDDSAFIELATGAIGEGAAAQFVSFMRVVEQLPDFEDIVADPKKCKLPDKERPDAQYATTQMIAHRVDGDSAEPAFTYLERMPREFQVSGIRAAMQKTGPSLLQSKKFAGWLRQNQDLLVAANLLDPAKGSK